MLLKLRTIAWLLTLTGGTLLSGCSSVMYSETRDKQAQAAKAAWDKVDLKAQIEVPRKNRAAILAEQLATEDNLAKVIRDALIRGVVTAAPGTQAPKPEDGTVGGQLANVEAVVKAGQVTGLQLDTTNTDWASQQAGRKARVAALAPWREARRAETLKQRDYENTRVDFLRFGLSQPACDGKQAGDANARKKLTDWIAKNGAKGQAVAGAWSLTDMACADLDAANNAVAKSLPIAGLIAKTAQQLKDEKAALKTLQDKTATERDETTAALQDGEDAAEKGDRARVVAAAEKLKKNFAILAAAEDAFSIEFISAKKQESIDKFLAVVADTSDKVPPADANKAALAFVLFPKLFDDAQKERAETNKISLAPLVLQKALAKIAQDAATRDLVVRNTRITLLQQKLDVLTRQADAYYDVDVVAASLSEAESKMLMSVALMSDTDKPVNEVSATLDQRVRTYRLFAKYIDAGTRLEAESRKVDYRLLALANEQQLTLAEANVAQWNTLVGSNVDQMVAFGASGIKAEQVVAVINSLSLLWIGSGVN